MFDVRSFLKRFKRNVFAFALTFFVSMSLPSFYPAVRNFISWHAQYQLCQAAAQGKTTRVKLLLLAGADPVGFNTTFSPLHFASRYGQEETARLLLDAGADVNSPGQWQQTPLMESVQAHDVETARLLLSRGASVAAVDTHSGSAIWHATRLHNAALVDLLMTYGGRNCKDAKSALTAAVEDNDTETVRALLQGGVDPRGLSATPLLIPLTRYAEKNRQPEIVRMLKASGAR